MAALLELDAPTWHEVTPKLLPPLLLLLPSIALE